MGSCLLEVSPLQKGEAHDAEREGDASRILQGLEARECSLIVLLDCTEVALRFNEAEAAHVELELTTQLKVFGQEGKPAEGGLEVSPGSCIVPQVMLLDHSSGGEQPGLLD